jgi:hypothetical protein
LRRVDQDGKVPPVNERNQGAARSEYREAIARLMPGKPVRAALIFGGGVFYELQEGRAPD